MTDEPLDLAPFEEHLARWEIVRSEALKTGSATAWGLANARIETWIEARDAAIRLARTYEALLAEVKRLRAWVDTLQGRNRHDTSLLNGLKQAIGNEADRLGIPKVGESTVSLIVKIAEHGRAQVADAWDEGHDAGIDFTYGTYTDNPYRTQPEETP